MSIHHTTSILSACALAFALTLGGTGLAAAQSNSVGQTSIDSAVLHGSNHGMHPNAIGRAETHRGVRVAHSQLIGETSVDSGVVGGSNRGMRPHATSVTSKHGPATFAQSRLVGETSIDSAVEGGSNHGMTPHGDIHKATARGKDYADFTSFSVDSGS